MASEKKDKIGEKPQEAEEEQVAEEEQKQPAEVEEEQAAEVEEEQVAEEPAEASAEPAKSAESEADPETRELEEGWPRSWIVTTAILGIVAIIILARLVGQSWKKDIPVPRPGTPGAKQHAPGKVHRPGNRPAPGKAGPGHKGAPFSKRAQAPGAGKDLALLNLSQLSVPKGMSCVGKDGKLHKLAKPFAQVEACQLRPKDSGYRWYEIGLGDLSMPTELSVYVLPPKEMEGPFSMLFTKMSEGPRVHWIGGNISGVEHPSFAVVLLNHVDKDFTLKSLKVGMSPSGKRAAGKVVSKVQFSNVELPPGPGTFCLDADGKVIKMKNVGADVPAKCRIKVKGANSFRLEFARADMMSQVHFFLQPAVKGLPSGMEGMLFSLQVPDPAVEVFKGSLQGPTGDLALIFEVEDWVKTKTSFKSILLMGKVLPLRE